MLKDANTTVATQPEQQHHAGLRGEAIEPTPAGFESAGLSGAGWLRRICSFPVMLASLLVGAVFIPAREFRVDPDLWWHLKVGEEILATHHWPTADPYSFTVHGQPWIAYEWLGEVLWARIYHLGGLRGLEVLSIVLGSAVMVALYACASVRSRNCKAAFAACALVFLLAEMSFSLRPQMLGYLFLISTLLVLESFRAGRRWTLWLLPLLFLLWVNTHGTFVIGLGVVLLYWLCGLREFRLGAVQGVAWAAPDRKRIATVFLLCLAVLPITPYGARLAAYPFNLAFAQPVNIASILEWQPMPFNLGVGKLFLALLLGFFLAQVAMRLSWRAEELGLFFAGTVAACLHARFLLLFVPFFTPLAATVLAKWAPKYELGKDKFALNAVLAAGVLAAVLFYLPSRETLERRVAEHYPVAAVEYLKEHQVAEPMFNSYGFGGYLVCALAPEHKVFIDGRADVYERGGVLADYMKITLLKPGAFGILSGYHVGSALLDATSPLATVFSQLPGWKRIYADEVAVLYERTDAVPVAGRQ